METTSSIKEALFVPVADRSASGSTMAESERRRRFEEVIAEHRGLIGRVAEVYERHPTDREDLIQEVLVSLWRALPAFRAESSLKTFVVRIAHNCAVTHISRRRPVTEALDSADSVPDDRTSPAGLAEASSLRERLSVALAKLPLGHRQAMALLLEGLSHAEAAEVLGITENNLTVRVSRARARLRELLEIEP